MSKLVSYTPSTNFKVTITRDGDVRIKVPQEFKGTNEEDVWVNKCLSIRLMYVSEDIKVSVRGFVKYPTETVKMISDSKALKFTF